MSIPLSPSADFSFGQWFTNFFEKKVPISPSKTITSGSSTTSSNGFNHERRMKYWIDWFLGLSGNEYFCKVDDSFILDRFNLTKLDESMPRFYLQALDMLTDNFDYREYEQGTRVEIEKMARHLYGLIHARFILTGTGMAKMKLKYEQAIYGSCPRYLCKNQSLLPVGISDQPLTTSVKLFCPQCEDVYNVRSSQHASLDGAYFGTTFAHLFLQTHPSLAPTKSSDHYVPRIFGFKLMDKNQQEQLLHHESTTTTTTSGSYHTSSPSHTHLVPANSQSLPLILPTII
ncbi:casein kinase II, regulatory subunit [Absidia repens]|uniref:Casein kinase II subunit beta n=1 Tax=Absidia repens TaxID=90262 RepID=A0A1X2I1Y0_9FUNG|nr:casein kinase II, regulatory subunit [Absidia repens]